jgi:protein-S-isoprenylcysteine O-methyltransferase
MGTLHTLTITLITLWIVSEVLINLITFKNRSRGMTDGADRLSYFIVWLCTVPPIGFAILMWARRLSGSGSGNLAAPLPLPGYVGCLLIAAGILIRLLAVATLKKQFTVKVSIVENHRIIDSGMYGVIRHPAYLGHLVSLIGIGLVSGNRVSLTALAVLPLAGILYRIHIEEDALQRHFGPAYQAYARRTKRLLPGIW